MSVLPLPPRLPLMTDTAAAITPADVINAATDVLDGITIRDSLSWAAVRDDRLSN